MISFGSLHVRPMGRACGEPNEFELTPIGVGLDGSYLMLRHDKER